MGIDWHSRIYRLIFSVLLTFLLPINESLGEIGTGVFPNTQLIEKNLVRNISTRADVQKLLGIPTGGGGAILPGFGENSEVVEPYDVWYYEDVKTKNSKIKDGIMTMDMGQQILMIFFKGDKFYGYFWTSNESTIDAH
jgi:hypothetical protein